MDYGWITFAITRLSGMLEPDSLLVYPKQMATHSFACMIDAPTELLPLLVKTCVCRGVFGIQAAKESLGYYCTLPVEHACLTVPNEQQQGRFGNAFSYYSMTTGNPSIPSSVGESLKAYKNLCRHTRTSGSTFYTFPEIL